MLQVLQGEQMYVVEFDGMPELPITYSTEEEAPYAMALTLAIQWGVITEPGKYGIRVGDGRYDIFLLLEELNPN